MAYGNYEARECEECGRMFSPKYGWQELCCPCWFETPAGRAYKARQSQWEQQSQNRYYNERQKEYAQGNRYYDHGTSTKGATLDKDFLRKLLMLCHPDKHGGSELANKVTVELLRIKKEME